MAERASAQFGCSVDDTDQIVAELAANGLVKPILALLCDRRRVLTNDGLKRVLVAAFGRRQWRLLRSLIESDLVMTFADSDFSRRTRVKHFFSALVLAHESPTLLNEHARAIAVGKSAVRIPFFIPPQPLIFVFVCILMPLICTVNVEYH